MYFLSAVLFRFSGRGIGNVDKIQNVNASDLTVGDQKKFVHFPLVLFEM